MSVGLITTILVVYFMVLIGISWLTGRNSDSNTFFTGNRQSPWYLVAFGMIGASLSGVTFISIPGSVGNPAVQFSYMQVVFGYLLGYIVIAFVLLPLYYRLNLVSIYTYLEKRFGIYSHRTGAFIFLVSRVLGASVRLMMVANVLQAFLFDAWHVPFEMTVIISIALIYVYTYKSGIKTIIWTDTLQTLVMLVAVIVMIFVIGNQLDLFGHGLINSVEDSGCSKMWFTDDPNGRNYFWKHFLGGMFITIGMTGLDQDMMQKNLTCRNLKDAQKNMIVFSIVLVGVNLLFLGLGALLYLYSGQTGVGAGVDSSDLLFPAIALDSSTGVTIGILFLIGLIAAAYSSADSALTALTTSVSYDLLSLDKKTDEKKNKLRRIVHISMSGILIAVIILLKYTTDKNAIDLLMTLASFTYGPLIGLFFFGIMTKRTLWEKIVPGVCLVSAGLTTLLWYFSAGGPGVPKGESGLLGNYVFGYELIIVNSLLTFVLLLVVSKKSSISQNSGYEINT